MALADVLRQMDINWLSESNHKISLEAFLEKWKSGEAILLDVRTEEEAQLVSLGSFGINIPLNQLPDRKSEIPTDKLVCTVCPGKIRAAIAYAFLVGEGFKNVKVLAASPSDIVDALKPGFVKKLRG
ncbi:rhodanese-like domain-containing protein [Thermovibrio ammonificans]|jgi:rhodanese-related sulfurtransferase|uniref:Rhodanese domain protein n=1 Tax=Thermovibrio ammonificans (strain DSM 15698 / JCM 12110 / HB-1) TaxID=648996 RepID=E8T338_THEA1|nr:rhodanese-like domain-containing protein [Thermovibrio ammonificans]ADU96043.1 Rhodanese domain protein [Thermovibrio ammonificans HB-1]